MHKKFLKIVLLLTSPTILLAGTAAGPQVAAIQSTYQKINDLEANFLQSTYVEVLGSSVKENGIFMMKKPGMLRIDYTGEHPKKYISNGTKLWIIDEELNQVETHSVLGGSVPKEALEFLKGFGNMTALFKISDWDSKSKEAGHSYLKLIPKNGSDIYNFLACDFGPDNILKKMTIHNKSGNISTYIFTDVKINQGLDKGIFIYK